MAVSAIHYRPSKDLNTYFFLQGLSFTCEQDKKAKTAIPLTGNLIFDVQHEKHSIGRLCIAMQGDGSEQEDGSPGRIASITLVSGRRQVVLDQGIEQEENSTVSTILANGQQICMKMHCSWCSAPQMCVFLQVQELGRNTKIENYTYANQQLLTNRLVFDMHPVVSGDLSILRWSVTPELPAGIELCPNTGVVRGLAKEVTPPRLYKIVAETEYTLGLAAAGRPPSRGDGGFTLALQVSASPEDILSSFGAGVDKLVATGNCWQRGLEKPNRKTLTKAYHHGLHRGMRDLPKAGAGPHRDMMVVGLINAMKVALDERRGDLKRARKNAPTSNFRGPCIVVPEDYPSIQTAVFESPIQGAHILVMPGTYVESVIVDRPVIIEGISSLPKPTKQPEIQQGWDKKLDMKNFADPNNGLPEGGLAVVIATDTPVFHFVEGGEDAIVRRLSIQGRNKHAVVVESGAPTLEVG